MPRTGEMIESKYLKKEDFDEDGTIVTIRDFQKVNVAKEDERPEMKWIMLFEEYDKGLVMNTTNIQLAEAAMGSDNTDDWIGKSIIVYVDPNVSFQGKLTGGLRVKAHRVSTGPKTAPRATPRQPSMADINRDLNAAADEDPPF